MCILGNRFIQRAREYARRKFHTDMLGLDDVEIMWLGCGSQRLEDAVETLHEVVMKGVLDYVTSTATS